MKLRAMDLFAGCGGLSLGLEEAGIDVLWANEINHDACETYRKSHPKTRVYEEDINVMIKRMLDNDKNLPKKGDVNLIVGGPPCQGFSGYNRFKKPNDPRNSLVESFLDVVDYFRPKFVLMENVPGMLAQSNGKVPNLLLSTFSELGYQHQLGILQAGYYGLPQNRWRVFIIAAKKNIKLPMFPEPTHMFTRTTIFGATKFRECVIKPISKGPSLFCNPKPMVTVGDAIKDLPKIKNGGGQDIMEYTLPPLSDYQEQLRDGSTNLFDHLTSRMGDTMLERCKAIPKKPKAGWLDLPDHLKPKNLLRHGDERYHNRFGRLHWEGNFNTILTQPLPYWGAVFHPKQDRVISVRECARAQGFPDKVHFMGCQTSRYKQVGNAVPPLLGRALGEEIVKAFNGK